MRFIGIDVVEAGASWRYSRRLDLIGHVEAVRANEYLFYRIC